MTGQVTDTFTTHGTRHSPAAAAAPETILASVGFVVGRKYLPVLSSKFVPRGTPVGQSGIERLRATSTLAAVVSGYAALPMQSTPELITPVMDEELLKRVARLKAVLVHPPGQFSAKSGGAPTN
jgi:hypothetical protein